MENNLTSALIQKLADDIFKSKKMSNFTESMVREDFSNVLKEAVDAGIKAYDKEAFANLPTSIEGKMMDFAAQMELTEKDVADINFFLEVASIAKEKDKEKADKSRQLSYFVTGFIVILIAFALGNLVTMALSSVDAESSKIYSMGFFMSGLFGLFVSTIASLFIVLIYLASVSVGKFTQETTMRKRQDQ